MPSFTICALSCRQNEWSIFFELRALLTSNAIRNFLESSRFFFFQENSRMNSWKHYLVKLYRQGSGNRRILSMYVCLCLSRWFYSKTYGHDFPKYLTVFPVISLVREEGLISLQPFEWGIIRRGG